MRRIIAVAGLAVASALMLIMTMGMSAAGASTVPVQTGNTLSGIAASHGVSLSALEAANPQLGNPNLIYVGQSVTLPGGGGPSAPVSSQPQQSQTAGDHEPDGDSDDPATAQPQSTPATGAPSSGGGYSIPGMPQSLANCIAFRESTNGTNPAANGNVFGIIPASGYNVAGQSLAQQEATAGQIYAQSGGAAWSADGCPGT